MGYYWTLEEDMKVEVKNLTVQGILILQLLYLLSNLLSLFHG